MAEAFWTPATDEQLKSMYEDLGTSEDLVERDVAALREWMSKQPHFPKIEDSADKWIAKYLIRSKNSMERTKEAMEMLLSGKNSMPEFFENRDPNSRKIQDSFEQVHIATMPKLTPSGERIHVYFYPENADADLFDVPTLFRRVLMKAELLMRDDLSRAEIVVFDLKNGSPSRLAQFTSNISTFRNLVTNGLKMYPARLKELHVINAPAFITMILSVMSTTLKDKLFKRIIVHPPGYEDLQKRIPPESLPSDYGGTGPSVAECNEKWRRYLEANSDWFRTLENLKTDESKRIESKKAIVSDDILGCQGSFRRLCVD